MAEFSFCIQAKLEQMSGSPRDHADHLLAYLEALARIDPVLIDWYRPGKSRKDALAHPLMLKGRRTNDAVQLLIEGHKPSDRNWTQLNWNGRELGDERSISLRVELPPHPPFFGNNLSLAYSKSGHATATPFRLIQAIMGTAVSHWPVKWARAYSHDTLNRIRDNWDETTAGWITYLAGDVDLKVPAGVQVIRGFADRGTLFVVSEENPGPDDALAIERLRALTHLLWDRGLLPRRPQLPMGQG